MTVDIPSTIFFLKKKEGENKRVQELLLLIITKPNQDS